MSDEPNSEFADEIARWYYRNRRRRHHHTRRIIMSLTLAPGAKGTLHATAYLDDAGLTPDPNAVISWTVDNPAIASVVDQGSTAGVGSCVVDALIEGAVTVTATATDPDGHTVSATDTVTVAAVAAADAVKVVITEG